MRDTRATLMCSGVASLKAGPGRVRVRPKFVPLISRDLTRSVRERLVLLAQWLMPAFQVIVCPWPLKIRGGFPLVVVINSMVDCNQMSIAANPPFILEPSNLSISRNFNLNCTLTSCLVAGVNWSMQMGPFHILVDQIGLDKVGIHLREFRTASDERWEFGTGLSLVLRPHPIFRGLHCFSTTT